jgi:hypothetical protein
MLINKWTAGEDYVAALKRRRWLLSGMLCVGIIGIVCYFLLIPGSGLPEFMKGFYLGGGSGITAAALGLLLRVQRLLKDPDARRKARIRETDEREVQISNTALRTAGFVTFYACAGALFVVLPINETVFWVLTGLMALYFVTFLAASFWLSRKL